MNTNKLPIPLFPASGAVQPGAIQPGAIQPGAIQSGTIQSGTEVLEALANAYFKAVPGTGPEVPASPVPPYMQELHLPAQQPETHLPDPNFPALGSSGFSGTDAASPPVPAGEWDLTPERVAPAAIAAAHFEEPFPGKTFPRKAFASYYFLEPDRFLPFASDLALRGIPAGQAGPPSELLDVRRIRNDFPILNRPVNGKRLVWLDNAATTQKPQVVIDRIARFYSGENSNIHRAAHTLAARATDAYEEAREISREFLNARSANEIVFVRGATEGINLVAKSWGEAHLSEGDEIIVSHLEHHANIVPWQQLVRQKGVKLKVIPVDDTGQVCLESYARLLTPQTRIVAFTQVSNALGTVTPARQLIGLAHQVGAKVLLDAAQSVAHLAVDVQALEVDWLVFSGHKIFGPTGIGVLYGKEALLNEAPPWQGGGNMIRDVTFEHTEYHQAPGRFEAGTGNIADAAGLGAALRYVQQIGLGKIHAYETELLRYATRLLEQIPGLRLVGTAADKAGVLSFTLRGYTNDEVGQALNREGVAVRTGHHCAQPALRRFGLESTVRPSLAFYNTTDDIDTLVAVLHQLTRKKTPSL